MGRGGAMGLPGLGVENKVLMDRPVRGGAMDVMPDGIVGGMGRGVAMNARPIDAPVRRLAMNAKPLSLPGRGSGLGAGRQSISVGGMPPPLRGSGMKKSFMDKMDRSGRGGALNARTVNRGGGMTSDANSAPMVRNFRPIKDVDLDLPIMRAGGVVRGSGLARKGVGMALAMRGVGRGKVV